MEQQKNFDFSKVGKRMPYTVPSGFFEEMQRSVLAQAKEEAKQQPKRRSKAAIVRYWIGGIATAATAAVVIYFGLGVNSQAPDAAATDFNSVEQAYCNLSTDDQDFMQTLYSTYDIDDDESDIDIAEFDTTEFNI